MEKETLSGLAENLKNVLECGPYDKATLIINSENADPKIRENPWEIVPIVTEHINRNVRDNNLELFNTCTQILDLITEKAYPDDLILLLIKDIEVSKDEVTVVTLLKPLGKCLKAMSKKRLNYLAWSFNAIQKYLNTINSVEDNSLNDEDVLLEYDEYETLVVYLISNLSQFYGNFIDDFRICDSIEQFECRDLLLRYILLLLGKPFAYLNTTSQTALSKELYAVGATFVNYVTTLSPDVCKILNMKTNYTEDEYVKVNDLALGVFAYYLFGEGLCLDKITKVYDNFYVFQSTFQYAVSMLATNYNCLIGKSNKLITALLNVLCGKLSYHLLDLKDHVKFCMTISYIIVYNPTETLRKDSLQVFRKYVLAYEAKGKYLIMWNLMQKITHKGFLGYLITFYKDLLVDALDKEEDLLYFSNYKLYNLLTSFCSLPNTPCPTDLMETFDKIISALNFIRYLLLRDSSNRTGVWDYYDKLEEQFFKKLQSFIASSRELNTLHLNELQNVNYAEIESKKKSNYTVTVKGEEIPNVTLSEEFNSLRSVLTVLDVVESLLQRVQTIGKEHLENSKSLSN